jgi:hypothetical protein
MSLGFAVVLLLLALFFGVRVRAYVVAGGVRFSRGWTVTRARDPITFWLIVVAYGAMAIMAGGAALVGVVYAMNAGIDFDLPG